MMKTMRRPHGDGNWATGTIGAPSSLHGHRSEGIVPGTLHLFLRNALFDQVLCRADGIRIAGNRDYTITGARCEDSLLRDLNVRPADLLYFD